MDVILLEKTHRGNIGDTVSVKRGYARNFLMPQGKAVQATPEHVQAFEQRRAELEKAAAEVLAQAQQRAEKVVDLSVTIPSRASEEGTLFGSVGVPEVVAAIEAAGVVVAPKEVDLVEGAMHCVGEYTVYIQFHSDVRTPVQVVVTPSEDA